jgi:hypothetical protein
MTTTGPVAERPHMPDYGVDTPDWEPLPWSWAGAKLDSGRNYWVVTVSAAGRPHALPVWGVWHDGDQRFCFSCAPSARKAVNLAANPRVTVATDDTVECLSVEGRAEPVGDPARRRLWADRYVAKYLPLQDDLTVGFLLDNLLFEVLPERAFGIIERPGEFTTRATRWRWPRTNPGRAFDSK